MAEATALSEELDSAEATFGGYEGGGGGSGRAQDDETFEYDRGSDSAWEQIEELGQVRGLLDDQRANVTCSPLMCVGLPHDPLESTSVWIAFHWIGLDYIVLYWDG